MKVVKTFFILMFAANSLTAQIVEMTPTQRTFSFGKHLYWPGKFAEIKYSLVDSAQLTQGVVTGDSFFVQINGRIEGKRIEKILTDIIIKAIDLKKCVIKDTHVANLIGEKKINISNSKFYQRLTFEKVAFLDLTKFEDNTFKVPVILDGVKFKNNVDFSGSEFEKSFDLRSAMFSGDAKFTGTKFYQYVTVLASEFHERIDFIGALFDQGLSVNKTIFDKRADFGSAVFNQASNFVNCTFADGAAFSSTKFSDQINFHYSVFKQMPDFSQCVFKDTVNFQNTQFDGGVDFRSANFDSTKTIYLEGMNFPLGQFYIKWNQVKKLDDFRIKIKEPNLHNVQDTVRRIEGIYQLLHNNFRAQGEKKYANSAMYELGLQKEKLLGDFNYKLYGWFLGYGYKPFRFVSILLILLISFSVMWYCIFYSTVAHILDEGIMNRLDVKDENNLKEHVERFNRYWHVLLFSSSVLLGIRFKTDWIKHNRPWFMFWVLFEWGLGIVLYMVFAKLVIGFQFEFVKSLLGY